MIRCCLKDEAVEDRLDGFDHTPDRIDRPGQLYILVQDHILECYHKVGHCMDIHFLVQVFEFLFRRWLRFGPTVSCPQPYLQKFGNYSHTQHTAAFVSGQRYEVSRESGQIVGYE